MEPVEKSAGVDRMLAAITGRPRAVTIAAGECMTCDAKEITAGSFDDAESRREYAISGCCQACQDAVFNGDDDDPDNEVDERWADAAPTGWYFDPDGNEADDIFGGANS